MRSLGDMQKGKMESGWNSMAMMAPIEQKTKKTIKKRTTMSRGLPKNLEECHNRFFESEFKINPQFEYEDYKSAAEFLEQYSEPDGQYLDIAT